MGIKLSSASKRRLDKRTARMVLFATRDVPAINQRVVDETIRDIKEDAPVDTGTLRRSIGLEKDGKVVKIVVQADYGVEVEYGTRFTRPQPFFRSNVRKIKNKLERRLTDKLRSI